MGTYEADQLVFVDESAVDRRTTYRGNGWSLSGKKASQKAFFYRGCRCVFYPLNSTSIFASYMTWVRFSVLPALALNDAIIHCDIVEGAFDSSLFYIFISRLLDVMQPFPAPKSVIVMDNCRIHKHPDILNLITER
jgi:DDE superfamily endonuclease